MAPEVGKTGEAQERRKVRDTEIQTQKSWDQVDWAL